MAEATKRRVARGIRFDQGSERHAGNDRHSYHHAAKDPDIAGRRNESGLGPQEHEATKKKVARPIRFDQAAERHSGNDRNSYHRAGKDPDIAGRSNEGGLGPYEHEATKKKVARPIRFDQAAERHSGNDRNSYHRAGKDPGVEGRINESGLGHHEHEAIETGTLKKNPVKVQFGAGMQRAQAGDIGSYLHFRNN
jgi:hypothetical protein